MTNFTQDIFEKCEAQFLNRRTGSNELQYIADLYASKGFPGCVGDVNCFHLAWKNFPFQEIGQYQNPQDSKRAVIKVEA